MISKPPHNVFTGLTATIAISLLSVSSAAAQSSVNEEAYAALLQEIADMKLTLAQQDVYLKTQEARMSALEGQIAAVEETKTAVGPMISKMVASIDNEITTDIPFKPEERFNRLGALRELVDDKEADNSTNHIYS